MRLLSASLFVGFYFLPASVLLYFAWAVWITNRRPEIAGWRLNTFKWGLILAPLAMAVEIPGGVHYLLTYGPPNWSLGVLNWLGLLLWFLSFVAAFAGRGKARGLMCCWAILAMVGLIGVYLIFP
jgi:hypothetical protein